MAKSLWSFLNAYEFYVHKKVLKIAVKMQVDRQKVKQIGGEILLFFLPLEKLTAGWQLRHTAALVVKVLTSESQFGGKYH